MLRNKRISLNDGTQEKPKADLGNKRNIFVQWGLGIFLAFRLYGFKSTNKVFLSDSLGMMSDQPVKEETIPVIRQDKVISLPVKIVDILNRVDHNLFHRSQNFLKQLINQ